LTAEEKVLQEQARRELKPELLRYTKPETEKIPEPAPAPAELVKKQTKPEGELQKIVPGEPLSVKQARAEQFEALGEGEDLRLSGDSLAGGALVAEDRVVHLAAFNLASGSKMSRRYSGHVIY
jgi:hypothetical protein